MTEIITVDHAAEHALRAVSDIIEILFPSHDPEEEWDSETIERIPQVLSSYGLLSGNRPAIDVQQAIAGLALARECASYACCCIDGASCDCYTKRDLAWRSIPGNYPCGACCNDDCNGVGCEGCDEDCHCKDSL